MLNNKLNMALNMFKVTNKDLKKIKIISKQRFIRNNRNSYFFLIINST